MDVGERIVSCYLKLNNFTFVNNIRYENNKEIDILARKNSDYFHIEVASYTGGWKFDYSYIEELKEKFPVTKNSQTTVQEYFGKNTPKKIWIHWEIDDKLKSPTELKKLKRKAKTDAGVDNIIELKTILTWIIHTTNIGKNYYDPRHDDTIRYINLFLLSLKPKKDEYFKQANGKKREDYTKNVNYKKNKRIWRNSMSSVEFLPRLNHSEWEELCKSLGDIKPDKIDCICSHCLLDFSGKEWEKTKLF
jgi:hypothetical protein